MSKRVTLITLVLLTFIFSGIAEGKITGVVVDRLTGDPLIGANVVVRDTDIGTATDLNGRFSISNEPEGALVLDVSYIGYKPREVAIGSGDDRSNITIRMTEDILKGEEVVVTGIASQTAKSVAEVSVSSIKASELNEMNSYQTLSQMVNSKVAGASVMTSSGNAGSSYRFDIRSGGGLNGNGQPVIYVDGIRVDNSEVDGPVGYNKGGQQTSILSTLNPEDIENIEILKGPASAATYGTDGANGVVLITTRKGIMVEGGSGYHIDYKYQSGVNKQSYKYTDNDIYTYRDANRIFRDGLVEAHSFNIAGGTESSRYYLSLGKRREQGITRNNSMNRKNIRLNVDALPTERLKVSVTTSYAENNLERPENDNNIYGYLGNTVVLSTSYLMLDSLSIEAADENRKITQFSGSVKATYTPFKNLKANIGMGLDNTNLNSIDYYPPWGGYLYDHGARLIYNRQNTQYTYDANVHYSYKFKNLLDGTATVGLQAFDYRTRDHAMEADSLSSNKIKVIQSASDMVDYQEGFQFGRKAGVYFNNKIAYRDRVFFTAGIREDFASSLSDKAPNIYYPNVSTAVRLDKFGLLPSAFDMAKFRIAYGETGQLPLPEQTIKLLWAAEQSGYGPAGVVSQIGDKYLEPERIKELEMGVDLGLFSRYGLELTYSKLNTENSIVWRELAPSTGLTFTDIPANVGKVTGWALELALNGRLINRKNLQLSFNQLNTWQKNKVIEMGDAQPIWSNFDTQVIMEGMPKYTFYDYKVDSVIYDTDGRYSHFTLTDEKVNLGSAMPFYRGSLSFSVSLFKDVTLYTLFDWKTKCKILNYTKVYQTYYGNNVEYEEALALVDSLDAMADYNYSGSEYRDAAETIAKYESVYFGSYTGFIEDADYFKVREMSVSYDATRLLDKLISQSGIRKVTFTLSGTNLLTWAKYSGPDPEVNATGASSNADNPNNDLDKALDFMTLQHPKTIMFSIQLGL